MEEGEKNAIKLNSDVNCKLIFISEILNWIKGLGLRTDEIWYFLEVSM